MPATPSVWPVGTPVGSEPTQGRPCFVDTTGGQEPLRDHQLASLQMAETCEATQGTRPGE